jgi:hypothetical protein
VAIEDGGTENLAWKRYGRAVIQAMAEVTAEVPEESHALLLETADYWLSLGLAIGVQRPDEALRLLDLIEAEATGQSELAGDAAAFCAEALG